jgi:hypothetical protein
MCIWYMTLVLDGDKKKKKKSAKGVMSREMFFVDQNLKSCMVDPIRDVLDVLVIYCPSSRPFTPPASLFSTTRH